MEWHDDLRWLREHVAGLETKVEMIMGSQDDINAAVAQIQATQALEANAVSALGTDVTSISAALQGGGTPVDTSALVAAVAAQAASDTALVNAVNAVTALVPSAAPAPTPAPAAAAPAAGS